MNQLGYIFICGRIDRPKDHHFPTTQATDQTPDNVQFLWEMGG